MPFGEIMFSMFSNQMPQLSNLGFWSLCAFNVFTGFNVLTGFKSIKNIKNVKNKKPFGGLMFWMFLNQLKTVKTLKL